MSKISQSVRNELLNMMKSERKDARCAITKQLFAEASALTHEIDAEIENIEVKLHDLRAERARHLGNKKLLGVVGYVENSRYQCKSEDEHPSLTKFDAETKKQRKAILLM